MSYGRHGRKYKRELDTKTTPIPVTTTTEDVRMDASHLRPEEIYKTEELREEKLATQSTNIADTKVQVVTRPLEELTKQILQSMPTTTDEIHLKPNISEMGNRLEFNKYYTISFL